MFNNVVQLLQHDYGDELYRLHTSDAMLRPSTMPISLNKATYI